MKTKPALTLESMNNSPAYNSWTMKQFQDFLKGNILEVGCGIGNFTKLIARFGKVWAIDVEREYVDKLKKKVDGRVQIGFGDVEQDRYFFSGRTFDCLVCLNVLEHIKDDRRALLNMSKLLKKGGLLILLVPAHQFLFGSIDESIGHFRRYEKADLKELVQSAGLKIKSIKRLNFLGALGWLLASRVFHDLEVTYGKIKLFNLISPVFLKLEQLIEPPIGTSLLVIAQKITPK